jgi:hypothetical protein
VRVPIGKPQLALLLTHSNLVRNCFDRVLVAVQVWSAVALSHLLQHGQDAHLAVVCTGLRDWCDAVSKGDHPNAYRPHRADIAAVRLRIAENKLAEPRGLKRSLEDNYAGDAAAMV